MKQTATGRSTTG